MKGEGLPGKVNVRLSGKGNSHTHGARLVHLITTRIKWIRTSRLKIKNSLSAWAEFEVEIHKRDTDVHGVWRLVYGSIVKWLGFIVQGSGFRFEGSGSWVYG